MGLAEPRKRLKLSHDPNNTAWTSQPSFGSALMQKSGWTPGTALGASSTPIPVSQSTAAQVKIRIKDDTLGLGANLKSRDIEAQRTGLDAFQGLLGRLNAKDQSEVKAVEEKIENKKLAMFAMGRWGGMVFVPGGVLVQEDPKKKLDVETKDTKDEQEEQEASEEDSETAQKSESRSKSKSKSKKSKDPNETPEQRAVRKAEKRARKEARLLKKLQKESLRTGTGTETTSVTSSSAPSTTTNTGTSTPVSTSEPTTISVTSLTQEKLKNGRHLLRGRNIQAKKMAFSDARGLDQIFMRRVEGKTEA